MACVKALDVYRVSAHIPVESAGRMRTYLKGKTMPARHITGRGIIKEVRLMTTSDFITEAINSKLEGVTMDAESREWVEAQLRKNLKERKRVVEKHKSERKPPEQWLKRGPKPGKKYPKYLAAMKRLGEERKARREASAAGDGKSSRTGK